MNEHQRLAIEGLERMRGDDLVRCKHNFRTIIGTDLMNEEHGRSGQTRQEVMDGYQQHSDSIDAAIKWVESRE
jgi:hypothetical protein